MVSKAKKTVANDNLARDAGLTRGSTARRAVSAKLPGLSEIPKSDLTPEARSAVDELMAELDRVKDELLSARRRVTELETKVDEDALLPVLNRRGFDRELERTLAYVKRHGTEVSLIYIDLDDFKLINDIYGHATGDAALMHLADILIANVRRSDVVARLGGDEFSILLHRADEGAANEKANQLARALASSSLVFEGKEVAMSLTAGVTQLRNDDTNASAMARADRIMYAGKARRKHS
ncbi:MAG: GGDEF domain-containing protein [Hyphomicrobiaceae bacterium]|nr:GGDEF domain-containing protein [Hyphomicrobiaceae bacterium]